MVLPADREGTAGLKPASLPDIPAAMSLHLIKMAVGIEDVPHLARVQQQRREQARARGEAPVARHLTRMTPRRSAELLDGGSIYWVIRGLVQVRQRILALDAATGSDGVPRCAIGLDAALLRVVPRPCRPFQGWRYLDPADAPPDSSAPGAADSDELPPQLAAELRELGLL